MTEQEKLRVNVVSEAGAVPLVESHPAHPNRKAIEEIPVATDGPHKGLRVRIIRHSDAEREALKALGDKRAYAPGTKSP